MFTTMRKSVIHMNQVSRLKVKVTQVIKKNAFRSKTSKSIEGFQYNLAQKLTIVRRSVIRKIQVPVVKVTHRGKSLDENVYSDHLVISYWSTNGHYHDYYCEAKYCVHNPGPCYQSQGHKERSKFVYGDHWVIIFWWIVTQMITIMTTGVTHLI
jgi:hypothetical protein